MTPFVVSVLVFLVFGLFFLFVFFALALGNMYVPFVCLFREMIMNYILTP